MVAEKDKEQMLGSALADLKYDVRPLILGQGGLEGIFYAQYDAFKRVKLTNSFRLFGEIFTPLVFTAFNSLGTIDTFTREGSTPLKHTLDNETYSKAITEFEHALCRHQAA